MFGKLAAEKGAGHSGLAVICEFYSHFGSVSTIRMRNLTRLLCVFALSVSVAFAESLDETQKKAEAVRTVRRERPYT